MATLLVVVSLYFTSASRNPYEGVEWVKDYPGAGDRYVTFSPVLASDHRFALGPSIGADYGELYFRDLNRDGIKEAIVESNPSFTFEEFCPGREVLEYRKRPGKRVEFVRIERLSKN
ncbi:hypothetical protein [Hymenobacter sp. BRD67]|uniref:hypothetical protein n=1 Tax=Hymenobacter sp. BRD67 TaxID=2675877 RepID=UPI00156716F0|nr:hypothetical protein [Hymenobacter sp. BRD67]QKG52619.1 hypothetical protein GKZ67_08420 [Hymenobacter sp. BRD67]